MNQPDPKDAIGVLAKVGGFDIAGMAGMFLGGAALGVPVVIDGFISCVAALIAQRICPLAGEYMIASHVSKEPAARLILEALGKEAVIHGEMCLGEGSGAVALFPFLPTRRSSIFHLPIPFQQPISSRFTELVHKKERISAGKIYHICFFKNRLYR